MTQIGSRRKYITIQSPVQISDGKGGFTSTYESIATDIKAKITTLRSDESIVAMATQGYQIHNINIRYRTGIHSKCRILMDGRYFAIIGSPINVNMKNRELDIKCKEITK